MQRRVAGHPVSTAGSRRCASKNKPGRNGGGPPSSDRVARQMLTSRYCARTRAGRPSARLRVMSTSSPNGSRSGFAPSTAAILQSTLPRPLLPEGLPLERTTRWRPSAVHVMPQVSPSKSATGRGSPVGVPSSARSIRIDRTVTPAGRTGKRQGSTVRRYGRIPPCHTPSGTDRSDRGRSPVSSDNDRSPSRMTDLPSGSQANEQLHSKGEWGRSQARRGSIEDTCGRSATVRSLPPIGGVTTIALPSVRHPDEPDRIGRLARRRDRDRRPDPS